MKRFRNIIITMLIPLILLSGCSGYQMRINNINPKQLNEELDKSEKTNIIIVVLIVTGIIIFAHNVQHEKGEYIIPSSD